MSQGQTTKVVVENLPPSWMPDYLRNFLEVITPLVIKDNGIHTFRGISHTALLHLEEPVSVESVVQLELTEYPFVDQILKMKAVTESTQKILVHYEDPDISQDDIWYYLDTPECCGEAAVEDVNMYTDALVAVVGFSFPEGVEKALSKGDHCIKKQDKNVAVVLEPFLEEFHPSLLQEICTSSKLKKKPPVAPKPKCLVSPAGQPHPVEQSEGYSELACGIGNDAKAFQYSSGTSQQTIQDKDTSPEMSLEQQLKQLMILKEKAEKLESENEKLKNVATQCLDVPPYQLRLLKDFPAQCESGCKVQLLENNVLFTGTEEQCLLGKMQLMKEIQTLADATLRISRTICTVLESRKGKCFLDDVVQKHPGCSVTLQDGQLLCAAHKKENLDALIKELEAFASCKTCKLPSHLLGTEEFSALRGKVQNEYLVLLTLRATSNEIQVEGFCTDVELAIRELHEFINKNQADEVTFCITGALKSEACKKWFAKDFDAAKQLIRKNGEIREETTDKDGFTLRFQCRQSILSEVMEKLNYINNSVTSIQVDLNKKFPSYSDRALVVNGLHGKGIRSFCALLNDKLIEEGLDSIGDMELPDKYTLPRFRVEGRKKGGRDHTAESCQSKNRAGHSRKQYDSRAGSESSHKSSNMGQPSVPCSCMVGNTKITVKPGDITTEQVAAAVSVIGRDLKPTGTAIGSAFLNKCPSIAEALQADSQTAQEDKRCHVRVTPSSGGTLPMSDLYHAVLNKMPSHSVPKAVKQVVNQCLTLAMSNGITSIAFPPLGVGRRFGYGRYNVANAMMSTFQDFLKAHPNSFQTISVVVADSNAIGRFAEVLKNTFDSTFDSTSAPSTAAPAAAAATATTTSASTAPATAPPAATPAAAVPAAAAPAATPNNDDSSASEDNDSDADIETVVEELPIETLSMFTASVCTRQTQDTQKVIDILLRLLRTTFLWHQTLRADAVARFRKLKEPVLMKIAAAAVENDVHLSLHKDEVRLCGMKESVLHMQNMVQNELFSHIEQQGKEGNQRRLKLGLPSNTNQMPSYWKISRKLKDPAKETSRPPDKLNNVTSEEFAAVVKLVEATWEANKTGAGKDARNLSHTTIKVKNVQRLENQNIWMEYSHKREQIFHRLERVADPSKAYCTPVENITNSSGPLKTTANIDKGSLLTRDIYPQVNEHYLFHGTKQAVLRKLCQQGLDFRMANDKTMLGRGVYAAESSSKADQYTDPKTERSASGQDLTMILIRVLLGEPFLTNASNPTKYSRPPCLSCNQARDCSCTESRLYDSIIDDGGRIFREFVVYDQHVCYPEYFVTYNRV